MPSNAAVCIVVGALASASLLVRHWKAIEAWSMDEPAPDLEEPLLHAGQEHQQHTAEVASSTRSPCRYSKESEASAPDRLSQAFLSAMRNLGVSLSAGELKHSGIQQQS